jgi:hypothetical protein
MRYDHPANTTNCTAEERAAFDGIMKGESELDFDPELIASLIKKGLLTCIDGSIVPPASVWMEWSRYKEQQHVDKIDVEIMGLHVGEAATWDQTSETEVLFYGFKPNDHYRLVFPAAPEDGYMLKVDTYKGSIVAEIEGTPDINVPFDFTLRPYEFPDSPGKPAGSPPATA